MRLIDADKLHNSLKETYDLLQDSYNSVEKYKDKFVLESQLVILMEAILRLKACPTVDAEPVRHGEWVDGRCSECGTEAPSTSWDDTVYDYDWEENLRYSHTETHTEYSVTDYCPNCGAKMIGGKQDG